MLGVLALASRGTVVLSLTGGLSVWEHRILPKPVPQPWLFCGPRKEWLPASAEKGLGLHHRNDHVSTQNAAKLRTVSSASTHMQRPRDLNRRTWWHFLHHAKRHDLLADCPGLAGPTCHGHSFGSGLFWPPGTAAVKEIVTNRGSLDPHPKPKASPDSAKLSLTRAWLVRSMGSLLNRTTNRRVIAPKRRRTLEPMIWAWITQEDSGRIASMIARASPEDVRRHGKTAPVCEVKKPLSSFRLIS